jgi:type VI secretion system protein ImpA
LAISQKWVNSLADFNVENFLNPISSDPPCGKSLEHDTVFLQLENAAKFIAERQMGETKIPEVVPDWKKVRDLAIKLLEQSRDIQVSMHLTCALLWTQGFAGFVQGLSLIQGLLDKYWEDVHPRPDTGDVYPILRINTLSSLNDNKKVLAPLAQIKLTHSKAGEFSWLDIKSANNTLTPTDSRADIPDPKLIEAAFLDTALATLTQQAQEVKQAIELSQGIAALVAEKSDSVYAPDFSPLINLLTNIDKCLTEKIQQRAPSEIGSADSDQYPLEKPSIAAKIDGIQSRDEVILALDAICKYFERNEPSSPIPFLMLRAKKLLSMNFMDILRDMAPDAVNQAEKICGVHKLDNFK